MSTKTAVTPAAVDRLLDYSDLFVSALLDGVPEWEFLSEPVQERFLALVSAQFAALPWHAPLAAYGLGVLDAYESSDLPLSWARVWRDALIERVERGVLAEMVRCKVFTYAIAGTVAA